MLKQILICLKRKNTGIKVNKNCKQFLSPKALCFFLAGVAGFEPADVGVRIQGLTAWRHPKINFKTQMVKIKTSHRFLLKFITK